MHVSLYVSDIAKSVAFYTQFFGQEPAKVKPNYAKYVLENPSLIISFVENKERVQSNFGHLGFQVETPEDLNIKLCIFVKIINLPLHVVWIINPKLVLLGIATVGSFFFFGN